MPAFPSCPILLRRAGRRCAPRSTGGRWRRPTAAPSTKRQPPRTNDATNDMDLSLVRLSATASSESGMNGWRENEKRPRRKGRPGAYPGCCRALQDLETLFTGLDEQRPSFPYRRPFKTVVSDAPTIADLLRRGSALRPRAHMIGRTASPADERPIAADERHGHSFTLRQPIVFLHARKDDVGGQAAGDMQCRARRRPGPIVTANCLAARHPRVPPS